MLSIQRSVTCPWCKSYYASAPLVPNCVNCGGPLPKAGPDKGEKPDEPPRILPKKLVIFYLDMVKKLVRKKYWH